MKCILVDESVFVYAKRADIPNYSQLMLFLSLSDRKNRQKKFRLVMANVSRNRLGMQRFYHFSRYVIGINRIDGFDKRARRRHAALKHVHSVNTIPLRPHCFAAGLIPGHTRRCRMDLFLFANEAKAKKLRSQKIQMTPDQVIPMETCEIAQVAYTRNLPIFSFNQDFKYFCGLPNRPQKYIEYLDPETFLQHLNDH